jgi:hypothetical protein
MWKFTDDINEAIAERRYDQRCDRIEEQRKAIQERKRKRREVQQVLIEIIGERKHSPEEMARISGFSKTHILSLSRKSFTKEEHREFLAMDEGIPPNCTRTPLQIDLRTEEEKWLDWWQNFVEQRMAADRELFVRTEVDKRN